MDRKLVFLDIETTGLDPAYHDMCSLGAVLASGEGFYRECRVYTPRDVVFSEPTVVDPRALAINGFTLEDLHDERKPLPGDAWSQFLDWLRGYGSKFLLAGENLASFDVPFLKKTSLCSWGNAPFDWAEVFGHRYLDMHTLGFSLDGQSMSLKDRAELLLVEPEPEPHNAMEGAMLCKRVFEAIQRA